MRETWCRVRDLKKLSRPFASEQFRSTDFRGGSPHVGIGRREFITLVGGGRMAGGGAGAAGDAGGRFLSSLSATDASRITAAFYQGLNETGYIDGRNVAVEFRWADGQYDRLPAMADELVQRKVAVIAAISGAPAGLAAKSATTSIPIVFAIGGDPVAPGLVTNLSRPAGNVTGVTFFTSPLAAKRLGLLHDLVPKAATIAVLRIRTIHRAYWKE